MGDDDARRYRSLVEATSEFVWVTDPEGRLVSDIPRWREITGQEPKDLLGHAWLEAVHPEDRPRVEREWRAKVAAQGVFVTDYRIADRHGGWRELHVRGVPVHDGDGDVYEFVGVCDDVTEERALQRAVAAEQAVLARVIQRSPAGICLVAGPDLRFRLVNERFREMLPTGRELLGRPAAEALPETVATAIPLVQQVRTTGEPLRLEDFALPFGGPHAVDGHRFYTVTLTAIPEIDGVLVVGEESTDRVRLRRELQEERHVAELLQRSLHLDALPALPGLRMAVRYLPGGPRTLVGGDWYDALALPDGRAGLAMGDVAGRGVRAATVMGQARAALRAYALDGAATEEVVGRLDAYVTRLTPGEWATLVYAVADPAAGTLTYTCAGHVPPLLVSDGGPATYLRDALSAPLGSGARAEAATVPFAPGATLVLCTDGLVEERDESLDAGLERLAGAVTDEGDPDDLELLADRILARTLGDLERDDDVALLIVRAVR